MTVTQPIFNYIFQHVAQFQYNKMKIVNTFANDFDEYMLMLSLVKDYINRCERFLGDMTTTDGHDDELPFVIFNCIVRLSSECGEDWSCCVTLPKDDENSLSNVIPIPCNSPEASELILKKRGESIVVEKDGKSNTYTVKHIEPNPLFPLHQNED